MVSLLKEISNPDKEFRKKAEDFIFMMTNYLDFYKILVEIITKHHDKSIRTQSFIVLKNIIKTQNVNSRMKQKGKIEDDPFEKVLKYLKEAIASLMKNNFVVNDSKDHLMQIIILLGDKYFPDEWEEYLYLFQEYLNVNFNDCVNCSEEDLLNLLSLLSNFLDSFYCMTNSLNAKKTNHSKNKYQKLKAILNKNFKIFFERTTAFYLDLINSNINEKILISFKNMIVNLDKCLSIIIEISFSINEFIQDNITYDLFVFLIDKTTCLNNLIDNYKQNFNKNNWYDSPYGKLLLTNFYENLLGLSRILSHGTARILFFSNISNYSNILIKVLTNFRNFPLETMKLSLFSFYKIFNTDYLKDNGFVENNQYAFNTPDKKIGSYISNSQLSIESSQTVNSSNKFNNLVSPVKFKNYELQVNMASKSFQSIFTKDVIKLILNYLVKDIPIFYHKDLANSEASEYDLISSEISNIYICNYDADSISWNVIYRNLIETIFTNYSDIIVYFLKEYMEEMIKSSKSGIIKFDNLNSPELILIDTLITIINLFPEMHLNGNINQCDLPDCQYFLNFIEFLVSQNICFIKQYVYSIFRWTKILISNNILFQYMNNIGLFLINSNSEEHMMDACLALQHIITQLENFFSNSNKITNIKLGVDMSEIKEMVNREINWSDLLSVVTKISFDKLINENTSAENTQALIKLITSLLERTHFQNINNSENLLNVIKNSKLKDIIANSNEFTCMNFIEMFKILIYGFSDNLTIIDFSLSFIETILIRKVDHNNLSFFLFFMRCIGRTLFKSNNVDKIIEIQNKIVKCGSLSILLLNQYTFNYSNCICFQIVEECLLWDLFDAKAIIQIMDILYNRISSVINLSNSIIKQQEEIENNMENKILSEMNNNLCDELDNNVVKTLFKETPRPENNKSEIQLELILNDVNEYKCNLCNLLSSALVKYYNNLSSKLIGDDFNRNNEFSTYLINIFFSILKCLFFDIVHSKTTQSTLYNSALLNIVNRLFLLDSSLFLLNLEKFLNENSSNSNYFIEIWLLKMENTYNNDTRKINVIVVCLLLEKINKEIFSHNKNVIYNICLNLVHKEMMKKIRENENNTNQSSIILEDTECNNLISNNNNQNSNNFNIDASGIKSVLITSSKRKLLLFDEIDIIKGIDLHSLFINKFLEAIKSYGISYEDVINFYVDGNLSLKTRLNEIFGLEVVID